MAKAIFIETDSGLVNVEYVVLIDQADMTLQFTMNDGGPLRLAKISPGGLAYRFGPCDELDLTSP